MNILLITSRADLSGGPKHIQYFLEKKNETSFNYYLACPETGELSKQLQSKAIKTYFIPERGFTLTSFKGICEFVKDNEIKIIHSHGRGAGTYSRLMKLLRANLIIVHTFHGVHLNSSLLDSLKNSVEIFLSFLTDHFIFLSESERLRSLGMGITAKNSTIIPNGIHIPARKPDKLSNFTLNAIAITREDPIKGLDLLIKNFNYIERISNLDLKLKIIGCSGKSESKNLTFKGKVLNILDEFTDANIFISTSRSEGLPLSLLEAMANGLICVCSNIPGHSQVIEDKKNGFLFDPENEAELLEVLSYIYTNYEELGFMVNEAFKDVNQKYSINTQREMTTRVYRCFANNIKS